MWVSEVCFVVFDSLVPPVKAVSAAVAVPVCSFKPFLSFYGAHNLTVVTATQHFQTCRVHKRKKYTATEEICTHGHIHEQRKDQTSEKLLLGGF